MKLNLKLPSIGIILLIICNGVQPLVIHSSTVHSYDNHKDTVIWLPDNGSVEYRKLLLGSGVGATRFTVMKDGRVYSNYPLFDLDGRTVTIGVIAKDLTSGRKFRQKIVLQIVGGKRNYKLVDGQNLIHERVRRAVKVSIMETVDETVSEILLDYASVGVINNADNRFYLVENADVPFSSVDPKTGKLLVNMNRRLDYETAPSQQYQLIVYINNTISQREHEVNVTIKLRDINDEPPVFTMEPFPYLAVFDANLPPNSKVNYDISVRDPDATHKLSYTLLEGGSKFRITEDGELYTIDRLSQGSEYTVRIRVDDVNAQAFITSQKTTVAIQILADRRPPQFYKSMYEASIPENVQGVDLDTIIKVKSFQGDAISFTIPESQVFMIVESANRPNEAKIRITKSLDYETETEYLTYSLVITATERLTSLSSTAKLTVTLTDINDNTPRFAISEYVDGNVWNEDTPVGQDIITVRATDEDPTGIASGNITYSLKSDLKTPLPFTVITKMNNTGYVGVIRVSGNLDYENIDRTGYRFRVIATDHGTPSRSSSAYVRVQVKNTNDEAPQFKTPLFEKIEATKTVNSVVTTVLASDPDGDKVSYAIIASDPPASPFRIESATGSVYLTKDLTNNQYVDKASFTLNVSATDDGSCCDQGPSKANVGYAMVVIEIVGRNHPPEFPSCATYSNIAKAPENTNNAFVVKVKAEDQDVGPNGDIRYSLVVSGGNLFKIDEETGDIRTAVSTIDREATSSLVITVKAEDGAQSKLSSFCTFTMQVQDLNDNDPSPTFQFSQDVTANSPPQTNIYNLFAVDPDNGVNGTTGLTYKVVGNDQFYIDGQTLRNKAALGSVVTSPQKMTIVVTDGGGRSKSVEFIVNIRQNATPPIFTQVPADNFSILENLTDDTIIAIIKAETATGGPVNYHLVPTTTLGAFYMINDKGCIARNELCLAIYQSQKLDADELRYYKLRVRVTPQSLGSNVVAEKTIDITLVDVNDNIPVFENIDDNGYIIGSVDENSTVINDKVVELKANDSDITPEFKTKTYSLVEGPNSDLFRVEQLTGIVRVDKDVMFDREDIAQYVIKVKATDGAPSARPQSGGQPNSQITAVQVNINDINDNAPYFTQKQYDGRVEETAPRGKRVMSVRASDLDIQNNFKYVFISGNDNQAFEIADTGDLLVFDSGRLDYETKKVYNTVVEVTDGRFQARTNVHIKLIDMNDNVPEFTQRVYTVTNVTEEDRSITTSNRLPIVRVKATDADVDRPNNITYDISGALSDRFQVDAATGQVYLVKPLDRDYLSRWDVNVMAYDEPNTATTRIGYAIISVVPKDINDNFPVFREDTLSVTIPEDVEIETQILTIRADDKDEGHNGTVKFLLKPSSVLPNNFPSQSYPYFSIDDNGFVKTLATFDRETVDKYTLEVIAHDEGTPSSKSVTETVTIYIGDVNDNEPQFVPDTYQRQVSELAGPVSFVLQVMVADRDSDAIFAFGLDNSALKNFSIDDRGNIFTREHQRLDFEHFYEKKTTPQINITVTVSDGKYSDTAEVQIIVVDENDETPLFDPNTVTVNMLENVSVNTLVHQFTATDRDALSTPRNSEIEYFISRTRSSDVERYFKIDSVTGEVRTQKLLDRETLETHTVKILAIDNGFPHRRTGTATLRVDLDDINDNGPRLVDPVVYIEENMPFNSHTNPRQIKAVDEDDNKIGHGPPFRMIPTNGSENNPFLKFIFHDDWDIPDGLTVANGAGEVLTKITLDREAAQGPEIDFYLQLFDKQDKNDVRLLTVVVADEDDNPPSPGHRDALIYNYKGWERDSQVVEIGDCYAEDKDDWDKPYKTYEKVGRWNSGFSIDANSGMISANLTMLPSGVYEFKCKVIDNYIEKTSCAFDCNVASGTPTQIEMCKDKCRVKAEAISTVKASIKTIDEAPVWNGASIRLKGTALAFVQPDSTGTSPYDVFIARMSQSLGTSKGNIDLFSVLDSTTPGFVDIRYTAHGSPYYNTSRLIGAVVDDAGLSKALGMVVSQVPVNECLKEICEGGCTNTLVIDDKPTLVNANGSSLVGITAVVNATCGCDIDDGSQDLYCTPDSCLNGGACVYNKASRTTSCECSKRFDGPRCQQLRHSFTGDGWAQYNTLSQCDNGTTSINVITSQLDGLILYNGPNNDPGSGADSVQDYLAVTLSNGKPVVYINYGTGYVKLTVNKLVNDGIWHTLELSKVDRRVTLTVDDCKEGQIPDEDTSDVSGSRSNCQDTQPTPGENRFLNVATLLELGGRHNHDTTWWPSELPSNSRKPYNGCVSNLKHNGELYDLHIGAVGRHSNTEDGCSREDRACLTGGDLACGINGICDGRLDGTHACICKPGWRGSDCNTETGYMDYSPNSFVEWELLSHCQGKTQCLRESYKNDIRLSFRSRDTDNNGLLFYVQGSTAGEYIKLLIVTGQLQLRYNIGSDSIDITASEQIVTLPVTVTDGALHHVFLTRYGKRFTLKLDGGEGRYFAQHEAVYSHQLFITDGKFFSGADIGGSNISTSSDLDNSCITDIRFNGKWFPSREKENSDSSHIRIVRRQNVADGCSSAGCVDVNCPGKQQCVDIWRDFDCRCPRGYLTLYAAPYCEDIDECFPDSLCVNGRCKNTEGYFECECEIHEGTRKLYTGQLCNVLPRTSKLSLASSGIIALIMSILLALLVALGIFCYVTRRSSIQKGETLIDPYNDIRETIYNYDEEGMPEEDQDGYDISRLSKPIHPAIQPVIQPVVDMPLGKAAPYRDQPDVGDFINGRLNDADGDPTNCLGDELKDYHYEGNGSVAGTLSSLNSSSSGGDQDFDYLNDWGPKFTRLADMYGGDDGA